MNDKNVLNMVDEESLMEKIKWENEESRKACDFLLKQKEFEEAWMKAKPKHDDRLDAMLKIAAMPKILKQEISDEKSNDAPIDEYPKMSIKFNDIINTLKLTETELITALSFIDGNHMVESIFTEPTNHIEAISIIMGFSQRISMLAAELRNVLE